MVPVTAPRIPFAKPNGREVNKAYLAVHGGVEGLIERGLAAFGDPGEEARQRRGAR